MKHVARREPVWRRKIKAFFIAFASMFYEVRFTRRGKVYFDLKPDKK